MKTHPVRLPNFQFRQPEDDGDKKMIDDIHRHGWNIIAVPKDAQGPSFAFTVGLYLRTLQPEILIMGVDIAPSGRVLNAIGDYLMNGGKIVAEQRYPEFVDDQEVIFRLVHPRHYPDYLGSAMWFYKPHPGGFPCLQCIWPDRRGLFPHEDGFDDQSQSLQIDLSI